MTLCCGNREHFIRNLESEGGEKEWRGMEGRLGVPEYKEETGGTKWARL